MRGEGAHPDKGEGAAAKRRVAEVADVGAEKQPELLARGAFWACLRKMQMALLTLKGC